jgi:soluble lytic murein transglycosylase-like protein
MRLPKWTLVLVALSIECVVALSASTLPTLRSISEQWAKYYAVMYCIPADLVMAIIDEESAWDPHAVSEKGAAGLMQLMPQTALRFGVNNRFRVDENIRGGVAYLSSLNKEFRGDLRLVTAAYYAGESPIRMRGLNYSSADVQAYVKRVAARYRARRKMTDAENAREQGGGL